MTGHLTWQIETFDGQAVLAGGDVGGDLQQGESWSARLVPVKQPDDGLFAIINVNVYAELADPDDLDSLVITEQNEFLICTDPSDPGGTEVWSDYEYDNGVDVRAYRTVEDAEAAAKRAAERVGPDDYQWDGRTRTITR